MTASNPRRATLFTSVPHACSYLTGRTAATVFIDPQQHLDAAWFTHLTGNGFRRSGDFVYRPHCPQCSACVPVRIPVNAFTPNRSQRRNWLRNQDLTIRNTEAEFNEEHFELYREYQHHRHRGGGMDEGDPQRYVEFLLTRHVDTYFYELRLHQKLLAVAVADRLSDGLSAVYGFYDPTVPKRGLGIFSILLEIEQARRLNLQWLYLGYWIKESPKMNYKCNFRPIQAYRNGRWSQLDDNR